MLFTHICYSAENLYPVYADTDGVIYIGDAWKDDDDMNKNGVISAELNDILNNNKYIYIYGKYAKIITKDKCYHFIYDNIIKYSIRDTKNIQKGEIIGYVKSQQDQKPMIADLCKYTPNQKKVVIDIKKYQL